MKIRFKLMLVLLALSATSYASESVNEYYYSNNGNTDCWNIENSLITAWGGDGLREKSIELQQMTRKNKNIY